MAEGKTDIVVGTHALLGAGIKFANLGLLIIDEEQHFGVKHKERLKELKSDVHVLTLSATPIPRTLQLAMTGVRELSLITTPPVDRMAVRTFISPFDSLVIRETLMREHYRGGQSFYVCPRLADLEDVHAFLRSDVPELKVAVAHGQMPAGELEDVMNAFYDGRYDVLLSTTIVESGLDVPTANTLIVHRADMFGLAQLYQLRGRVGRSKVRAFALFTLPVNKVLTATAERRLKVLQSLDTLGAGFQLASHDLDIRGAGNLLGEEQSGHIKEVGFELYQQMLEEAVAEVKGVDEIQDTGWSPQISVGTPVMIPTATCRTCICAWRSIVASARSLSSRNRCLRRRNDRPLRSDADRGAASFEDRLHQIALPHRQCRKAGRRPEGCGRPIPQQGIPEPGKPGRVYRQAGHDGEDPSGPQRVFDPRPADAGKAAAGRGRRHDAAGRNGKAVGPVSSARRALPPSPWRCREARLPARPASERR
ncbi:hypothetical protein AJ87_14345 [Rhizobium yanglingense]|nr:hypothetical protein AJ87_14345 [Rhizobium yanglingense]